MKIRLFFILITFVSPIFAKPTKVIQFEVKDSATVKKGKCWSQSIATPRKDAWRCMVDNSIYDPCFTAPAKNRVICASDPAYEKTGFSVELTEPLPRPTLSKQQKFPFQIKLADSSVCTPFTGTLSMVGKEVIRFGCENKSCSSAENCQVGILSMNQRKPEWLAKVVVYAAKEGKIEAKSIRWVPVESVWE